MNRRQFLQTSAGAAALLAARGRALGYSTSLALRKFIDPLPVIGTAAGPRVLSPDTTKYTGVDYYEIVGGVFRQQLHSDLPAAGTRLYGYAADTGAAADHNALGGIIIARKGTPVRIKHRSALPDQHILPVDASLDMGMGMGAAMAATPSCDNRMSVHLHGGLVPWASDGGPFHWTGVNGERGASNVAWLHDAAGNLTNDLYYPNNQTARLMWYHDHAMGITRLNAYAGLATGYLLTDAADAVVDSNYPLGDAATLILIFQDKVFYNPAADPAYANVAGPTTLGGAVNGDLWYPYVYEKAIWKMRASAKSAPRPSCVPEMFADTMLVNSRVFPFVEVKRGAYRFRTLNACNARFLNLSFVQADASGKEPLGGYAAPVAAPVSAWLIGTESGFLPAPVQIFDRGVPVTGALWLNAPAERSDMIVDFSQCPSGSKVLLYNNGPAPYPMGAPDFDHYPGNLKKSTITPGYGPNTRTIMQFRIGSAAGLPVVLPGDAVTASNRPVETMADTINGGLMLPVGASTLNVKGGAYAVNPVAKEITLNESFDIYGRLLQRVGNNVAVKGDFGKNYMDPVSEVVQYGSIEIWNVYNLTGDVHPMHFHLFDVKILRRRPFKKYDGAPVWSGPGRGPDPGEEGWKETVKMWPGECTTIAVVVAHPLPAAQYPRDANGRPTVDVKPAGQPAFTSTLQESPRTGGDEYVFHCHILEHEEHDMMRPMRAV